MKSDEKTGTVDHSGHRSRMLETFLHSGIDAFSDVQVLEFLLSYSIARRDVNPLAHALLAEFGTLHQVFEATDTQLCKVPGIGPRSAALLLCTAAIWRRCEQSRLSNAVYLRQTAEIGRYLLARADGVREERAWLISLDAKCKVLDFRELCTGSVNAVNLPYRRVVEAALFANASSVVLAHNHVNGNLLPSMQDVEYTRGVVQALRMVDVAVVDHIILGPHNYLSLHSSNMLLFR